MVDIAARSFTAAGKRKAWKRVIGKLMSVLYSEQHAHVLTGPFRCPYTSQIQIHTIYYRGGSQIVIHLYHNIFVFCARLIESLHSPGCECVLVVVQVSKYNKSGRKGPLIQGTL